MITTLTNFKYILSTHFIFKPDLVWLEFLYLLLIWVLSIFPWTLQRRKTGAKPNRPWARAASKPIQIWKKTQSEGLTLKIVVKCQYLGSFRFILHSQYVNMELVWPVWTMWKTSLESVELRKGFNHTVV